MVANSCFRLAAFRPRYASRMRLAAILVALLFATSAGADADSEPSEFESLQKKFEALIARAEQGCEDQSHFRSPLNHRATLPGPIPDQSAFRQSELRHATCQLYSQ